MTVIRVVEEIIEYPVRVLVCACSCDTGCGWGEILAQRFRDDDDPRSKLWLAMGPGQMTELHATARALAEKCSEDEESLDLVDRGCAYLGLPFDNLRHPHVCRQQEAAVEGLEQYHLLCDPEWVWSVRRNTFGEPLTCVVRAVDGIGAYYEPDVDRPQ